MRYSEASAEGDENTASKHICVICRQQQYLCRPYLNDDGRTFIHRDHSVAMGPSEHLQGRTVAPLQHSYIEPAAHTHTSHHVAFQ